jgi:hypothetical protein
MSSLAGPGGKLCPARFAFPTKSLKSGGFLPARLLRFLRAENRERLEKSEWETIMSLSAVLKAGLSERDTGETGSGSGWDPYPDGGQTRSTPVLKAVSGKKAAAGQPTLDIGLSDSLPKPKVTAPATRKPANANASGQRVAPQIGTRRAAGPREISVAPALKPAGQVNPQQYIRELDRYHAEQNRHQTRDAVMDVASHEVERVARLAARVRGRYIAKLLDAGNSEQAGLKEAELAELRRYRESHEELCHGLDLLKAAIAEGDISISGMIRQ